MSLHKTVSFTRWPMDECIKLLWRRALIANSKSPSKLELWKPSSWMITILAAKVSNIRIEDGTGIFSDKAAITSP